MRAFKQAAREGDSARLDALCDEWSVAPALPAETRRENEPKNAQSGSPPTASGEVKRVVNVRVIESGAEARR